MSEGGLNRCVWSLPSLLLLPLVSACGAGLDQQDRNLLIITIDTTRSDFLGCYGNDLGLSPNIDALAQRGAVFEAAFAPMPQTLPSHATLFTGLEPRNHGALWNFVKLEDEVVTLAEYLSAEGYETGAFIASAILDESTGIAQGFATFDSPMQEQYESIQDVVRRPADHVTDAALGWAAQQDGSEPYFMWAHYYDPHDPFVPPESSMQAVSRARVRSWVEGRSEEFAGASETLDEIVDWWHGYASEIHFMDAEIGRLLAGLERHGLLEDTVVILVADHGEGLYEHGERGHGVNVYDELMRVPLIVADPTGAFANRRFSVPVSLQDVLPTAVELVTGRHFEPGADGESLAPRLESGEEGVGDVIFMERPHYPMADLKWRMGKRWRNGMWGVLAAVLDGDHKLIRGPSGEVQLYDLASDPAESRDLFAQGPAWGQRLGELLDLWQADHPASIPIEAPVVSEERMEALRALGYAGEDED